jgi:hypothetical protein
VAAHLHLAASKFNCLARTDVDPAVSFVAAAAAAIVLLCACSLQRTMRIWEYSTGKILKTLSFAKGQAEGAQQAAAVQVYNRTHFVYNADATPCSSGSCAFSNGTLMRQLVEWRMRCCYRLLGRGFTSCRRRIMQQARQASAQFA